MSLREAITYRPAENLGGERRADVIASRFAWSPVVVYRPNTVLLLSSTGIVKINTVLMTKVVHKENGIYVHGIGS